MPTKKSINGADMPQELRPIDEQPPVDEPVDDPPPPPPPPDDSGVILNGIVPIAGALTGGFEATLTGTGFQTGAEVFFGSKSATQVRVDNETTVTATVPEGAQAGSVSVSLVNPDGSTTTLAGGFTYIATEPHDRAEVLGVSPLSIIENTGTEVTLRGRNLIAAYNEGIVAFRGPTRAHITSSAPVTSRGDATEIESLTFTMRVTATPPLAPLERIAIQVLASHRADVQQDGVVESSKQVFTVLPSAMPVPLAYTENLEAGKPSLFMVAGRNLEGCTLDFGDDATVHLQQSDERSIFGIVSFHRNLTKAPISPRLSILSEEGSEVGQYNVAVAPAVETVEPSNVTSEDSAPPDDAVVTVENRSEAAGDITLNLTEVPDQQLISPTEEDSIVFGLGGDEIFGFGFNFLSFVFTIVNRTFVIPIINEVRLIPFFDAGGGRLNDVPVVAEVGKLLRLRGTGLLVALRVEIIIHIRIVLIVGFRFGLPGFGFFNEFEDFYPWAFGSIVISIRILIQVRLVISALVALVEPGGRLNILFYFNLTLGFDFRLSDDHHEFEWVRPDVKYSFPRFNAFPVNDPFPCDGRFQLASDNGQTVFLDALQASQAFYMPRSPGVCCVPWEFDFELERVELESGEREVLQQSFRYDYCLNAAPAANLGIIIITSDPEPETFPRRLVMDVEDRATIIALAQPVDASGQPIPGEPLQDVRDLGYDVEFFLETPTPDVLDPVALEGGDAFALQPGDNVIHARLRRKQGTAQFFNFYPDGILGFDISPFVERGLEPAVVAGSLDVKVNPPTDEIKVEPTLAYLKDIGGGKTQLTEVPVYFSLGGEKVMELERGEPVEPARAFILAVKVEVGAKVQPSTKLQFTVGDSVMNVSPHRGALISRPPLEDTGFLYKDREQKDGVDKFFSVPAKGTVTVTVNPRQKGVVLAVQDAQLHNVTVAANNKEDGANDKCVPPGENVIDGVVVLTTELKDGNNKPNVKMSKQSIRMGVRNDETFEEYPRVFEELQAILSKATTLSPIPGQLLTDLLANGHAALNDKGDDLWSKACASVQGGLKDDRPLYYARLQCIGAIRAYARRKSVLNVEAVIFSFEWPSRGFAASGAITFPATATGRKAIVTGFDPFGLYGYDPAPVTGQPPTFARPDKSNPSGLIALQFNGQSCGSSPSPAYTRTVVFPVRYKEFDQGRVEAAFTAVIVPPRTTVLDLIVLLMTTSQNGVLHYYDVERWAVKNRSGFEDNNKKIPGQIVSSSPEFAESTLPYESVITSQQTLPGPKGATPFVIDQSYQVVGHNEDLSSKRRNPPVQPPPEIPGELRFEPVAGEPQGFTKDPTDKPNKKPVEGSGGNYLSNEIFYRTAIVRNSKRPTLASGHFHLPPTDTTPETTGPPLITGVQTALARFLDNLSHLAPVITSFSPTSGLPGTKVTITGERLDGAQRVSVNNVNFTIDSVSNDGKQVVAIVAGAARVGKIVVETPYGRAESATNFTVRASRRVIPIIVLAESLRARRQELGLTQRAAAQQMGIKAGTYSNWERGRDNPRETAYPAIIDFLGFDPSEGEEEQELPISDRIRERRESEGISQRELAERLGVAPSTVKAWEADTVSRPTPRVRTIFQDYLKEA